MRALRMRLCADAGAAGTREGGAERGGVGRPPAYAENRDHAKRRNPDQMKRGGLTGGTGVSGAMSAGDMLRCRAGMKVLRRRRNLEVDACGGCDCGGSLSRMQSKAKTVKEYLASLPADRRETVDAVRAVMRANLDPAIEEVMQYGMIGYVVPHSVFPAGYHCDPTQPLPYAALASQKASLSLYLMCVYIDPSGGGEGAGFREAWAKTGKKLDMGKSCIRFKKAEDLALDVLAATLRRVTAKKLIEHYLESLRSRAKPSAAKTASTGPRGAAKKSAAKSTDAGKPAAAPTKKAAKKRAKKSAKKSTGMQAKKPSMPRDKQAGKRAKNTAR